MIALTFLCGLDAGNPLPFLASDPERRPVRPIIGIQTKVRESACRYGDLSSFSRDETSPGELSKRRRIRLRAIRRGDNPSLTSE